MRDERPSMYTRRAMWRLAPRVLVFLACAALPAGAAPAAGMEDPARALDLIKPNRQQQAKDFKVAALEGGKLRLADLKGKVVFLNLWATWCPPCKEEMPAMERLWQRYKGQGLVVIALSMDSAGAKVVKPFIEQAKYTYRGGARPEDGDGAALRRPLGALDLHHRPERGAARHRPRAAGLGRPGLLRLFRRPV